MVFKLSLRNKNSSPVEMKFIETYKKKSQKSDEELLKEFISTGRLDFFGELYSRYMHLVYGVCLKYLKEREESKDAVMHIFEKLVVEIPRHKIENFGNWLHVVTRNYCLMQLRTDKSQKEKLKEWINDTVVFMEYSHILHPIDEDGDTLEKGLIDCIERLKGEQKACIRLFYYENRCYNEIASNLDLDEKKVKSHLQNAKRNLKLCLEEKHVGQE
jgi:RNA polymerase sigma-70 factor, ECF subfamily